MAPKELTYLVFMLQTNRSESPERETEQSRAPADEDFENQSGNINIDSVRSAVHDSSSTSRTVHRGEHHGLGRPVNLYNVI